MLRDALEKIVEKECIYTCPTDHEERDCEGCITSKVLALMRKLVEGKRQGRKICFGEDCTSDKVKANNKLVDDLLSELK